MLFRTEALTHRADRLSGDVSIAVPISWQAIGYLLLGSVAVGFAFLNFASYSRVEVVTGGIVPDAGITVILPTRAGIIASLPVRDGQIVPAGTELAIIRAEEDGISALSAAAQIEEAIIRQDASLTTQTNASLVAAQAQQTQLRAQRAGLAAETIQIRSQIGLQRDLIASAQKDYDRALTIADRGFISGRDLQVRQETLLSRQQAQSQLSQALAAKQSAISETNRSIAQVAAQADVQSASLSAARAEVAQQSANAKGSRSYVLRAPTAGKITALTARLGQPANAQTPLMTIIPSGSVLRAELAIPSAAIGFVKKGQEVRLAIDAFPYQRFGTITGKVLTVSTSAVSQQGPSGQSVAVYPVTVQLDKSRVFAFGREEGLVSGMTLTARIITEKQSLLKWLFEPLFAVKRR